MQEGEKAEKATKEGFGPSGEDSKETDPRGSFCRAPPAASYEHSRLQEQLRSVLVTLQTQTTAITEVVGGRMGVEHQPKIWGAP